MSDAIAQSESPETAPPPPRRSFFTKFLAIVFGTAVGVVPAIAGVMTLLDPLRRKSKSAEFIDIGSVDAVPADGTPRRLEVRADLVDAWNNTPNAKIGAVYVKRPDPAAPDKIIAWSVFCPHAGCFVVAQADQSFKCPCHDSEFNADGTVRPLNAQKQKTVSPRGLDTLETQVTPEGRILVKFEKFRTGSAEKISQA